MKKILPALLALLIVMSSCNSNKSFSHQRYTHFKSKSKNPVVAPVYYAQRENKVIVNAPETQVINAAPEEIQKPSTRTETVVKNVMLPRAQKTKEQALNLVSSTSKLPVTQVAKIKPLNITQKQEKRGLLFGVIDALLSVILLVLFVALVIFLILILI